MEMQGGTSVVFDGTDQPGDTTDEDTARAGDYDVYLKALQTRNTEVRNAALAALAGYPQAFSVIADYLEKYPAGRSSYAAVTAFVRYKQSKEFEKRAARILDVLYQSPNPRVTASVRKELVRALFSVNPKKYAKYQLEEVRQQLESQGENISFADTVFDDISALSTVAPKKDLYPLVPRLVSLVEKAFFPDVSSKAHRCLIDITGENYPLASRGGESDRRDVAERYRKYYYQKLDR